MLLGQLLILMIVARHYYKLWNPLVVTLNKDGQKENETLEDVKVEEEKGDEIIVMKEKNGLLEKM